LSLGELLCVCISYAHIIAHIISYMLISIVYISLNNSNPTYQWEIAWTLLGSCDSSTPYISPTTSPTSAAPTFAVWSGTGCPREFDSSLLTPYELGDVVTYDTNDGQGSLVYECISNVIGRCYQGGYTPGEPFVNEAWSVLGTCTGTLTPTTSPTETILAPWTLGGCPESFVSQTMYKEGDVVEDNGKVYEVSFIFDLIVVELIVSLILKRIIYLLL